MTAKSITRRKLLKQSALATIGASLFFSTPLKAFGRNKNNLTKVVLIRNKKALDEENKANPEVLGVMMDKAITTLTGLDDIDNAWNKILKPEDVLGIKSNVWSKLATPPELENYLKQKAIRAGIKPENISINDRRIMQDPVFKRSTALINVRPMRTHAWSGVGSLLKNYIMFVNRPSAYHGDSCADLAKIWKLDHVKGKTRLNILVMLTPLFHGIGPHHFNKQFIWKYNGLILGFDPVAVDSIGLRILQAKRSEHFGEDTPLNPPAKHILLADTRHKLGTANPEKIDLIKIGDQDSVLI
jgi:hypothetical protein